MLWGRMTTVRHRWFLVLAMIGMLVVASACGSDAGPEVAPTPTPGLPDAMQIERLVWTSAVDETTGEPVDEVAAYTTTSPAIVAVVEASNVPAGTTFTASWTIDGQQVPEAEMRTTIDDDMTTAYVAFQFLRQEDRFFPLGELEVMVTTNTGDTVSGAVEIELP